MRQDMMSLQHQHCMADPWFAEYFADHLIHEAKIVNSTYFKKKAELLLRLPHKASPEKPLTDTKVST